MSTLTITKHAAVRMSQRGLVPRDAELIALIGTEVNDGYLVREKDYREAEHGLKLLLQRFRRLVGKRLVVKNGKIVTAYHPTRTRERRLLRNARKDNLCDSGRTQGLECAPKG
jgi:hypothetical protein